MAKILVVDESADLLELFSVVLSMEGFEVETADSKNKLLNQLSVFAPDLIILEVRLNGADGRELCKEIKQKRPHKNIPIILISTSPQLLKDYEEFNADAVIEKPFDIKNVVEKITALLTKSH